MTRNLWDGPIAEQLIECRDGERHRVVVAFDGACHECGQVAATDGK